MATRRNRFRNPHRAWRLPLSGALVPALSLALALVLAGCAADPRPEAMTVPLEQVRAPQVRGPRSVPPPGIWIGAVEGGVAAHATGSPRVTLQAFREALLESLRRAGAAATSPAFAQYLLTADLQAVYATRDGPETTVQTVVRYVFHPRGGEAAVVYEIRGHGLADAVDGRSDGERLRIAQERSVRDNLFRLLGQLSELSELP